MTELDRTQQRIIGVLIEKELAVPDSYPLTENALIAACNQKSNRYPEMGLEQFEVHGAMVALMTDNWAKTVTGSRTTRYAHRLDSNYAVSEQEKAVLCELLVRGPQAPGALKQRVVRLGFDATPARIEEVLHGLAGKPIPMVECLAKRPRERDCRWRHRLGPMDPSHGGDDAGSAGAGTADSGVPLASAVPESPPVPVPHVGDPLQARSQHGAAAQYELERRVARLEAAVEELRAELRELK